MPEEFGTRSIVVGGESAGAYLALMTLIEARDSFDVNEVQQFIGANLTFGVLTGVELHHSSEVALPQVTLTCSLPRLLISLLPNTFQIKFKIKKSKNFSHVCKSL